MKRTNLFKSFILLVLILMDAFVAKAYDFQVNGVFYDIHGHNVTVAPANPNWYPGGSYSGDLAIPKNVTYNGTTYTVTAIGEGAFWRCPGLTSVTLPNSIITIEDCSFGVCQNMTSIDIPNSVTSIGKQAFDACSGLSNVYLGNSVTSIGEMAFYECHSLTIINIPNSVTTIGAKAFYNCIGLTDISIPCSVDSIGVKAFSGCYGLIRLSVENGNPNYDSRNNCNAIIETSSNTIIAGCMNTIIPNSVTAIGHDAFCKCIGLTSIDIPNSVISIGVNAFALCSGLTSLILPNSVTLIDRAAFTGCDGLTTIIIPNHVTTIGERAFEDCRGLTNVTIGYSVTEIGKKAFFNCDALTSVTCFATTPPNIEDETTFPTNVTDQATLYVPVRSVDAYQRHYYWGAFYQIVGTNIIDDFEVDGIYYHALTDEIAIVIQHPEIDSYYKGDIIIPDSVSYQDMHFVVVGIDDRAFEDCYELNRVVIGDNVETIGEEAFQGCTALTSVTIGSGVTNIKAKAFNYCNALQTVTCKGTVPPVMVNSDCFSTAAYSRAVLMVPRQSVETYTAADYWYKFNNIEGYGSAGHGDVNADGRISIADVTALIDLMLEGGEYNPDADFNYNGRLDISDVTSLIDFLLFGN